MSYTDNPYEKCANCVHCKKLYVPPLFEYKHIPKDAFVCVRHRSGEAAMFLPNNNELCECFTPIDRKEWIENDSKMAT